MLIVPPQNGPTFGEPSAMVDPGTSDIDPILLFRIPLSLDLTLHVSPVISLLIDFFLFESKFPRRSVSRTAPLLALIYGIGYGCFVEYCATFNGRCRFLRVKIASNSPHTHL
jgi:hypothetical protein